MSDQPIYANGVCTACRAAGLTEVEVLRCFTCHKRWHSACLSNQPALSQVAEWSCPDCSGDGILAPAAPGGAGGELVAAIRDIQGDNSLSEEEKARRRQELLAGSKLPAIDDDDDDSNLSCTFCTKLMERPVSTPCGHNFCFKCFQKWTHMGNKTCPMCRQEISSQMSKQPKINIAIAKAISGARISKNNANSSGSAAPYHHLQNGDSSDADEVLHVSANDDGEVNIPFFPLNHSGKTKRQFEPQGDSVSFLLARSSSSISPSALNPTNTDLPLTAMVDLPCDCDDACMTCHATPPPMDELLMCFTCLTLWHVPCLSRRPCVAGKRRWTCPDCPGDGDDTAVLPAPSAGGDLVAGSHTIEANQGLPERKKKQRHMELLAGSRSPPTNEKDDETGREILREY